MNKSNPVSFSVIIPTLNEEKRLPKLLDDLTGQSFKNFEVIIVDGKSDDQTKKKALMFKNKFQKLTLIISKKRNVSYQRNLGAKKATSDWLIFMDADSRIPYYFLQGIKFHTESLNADIITAFILPDTNNSKDKAIATIFNVFCDLQQKSKKPIVLESMLVIKSDSYKKLGGFDESLHWSEGGDLLKRARKMGMIYKVVKQPKYIYSFRRFRSQGTLKSIRASALLELARLQNRKLAKNKVKKLYPMEGGNYFEIDKKKSNRLKKLFSELFIEKEGSKVKTGFINQIFRSKN